jgi:bifunctional DNA-binding transcriptional regulator/antitoxin component of YhaV-PrlF toxin-antitoxin module
LAEAEEQLVKMSGKGQLVVPQKIRKREGLKSSDRFVAIGIKDGVLFKKVDIPKVKIEFSALSRDITRHLKQQSVRPRDVAEAIKWARKEESK